MDSLQTSCCFCFTGLKNHTDVWFVFLPAVPVQTRAPAILFSAGTFILLSLVTVSLLGHLLTFHIYLSKYFPVICIPISFSFSYCFFCIPCVLIHVTNLEDYH